jgi:hypothetical protein
LASIGREIRLHLPTRITRQRDRRQSICRRSVPAANEPAHNRAIADTAMKPQIQRGRKRDRESTGGGLVLGLRSPH